MQQKPSVGRVVHYMRNGELLAAIIVKVWNETGVNLTVFGAQGETMGQTSVSYSEELRDGCWSWPQKV